jgi:outer membrane protein TolC
MPDFWTIGIEPTESMPFVMQRVDVEDAIQRALANRTDVQTSKNALARQEIGIRYYRNQALPDVSAQAIYRNDAIGGALLSPINLAQIGAARTVVDERRFNSVLGDVLTNAYPTWTFGLTVAYPIGKSAAEANLARAKLQYSQAETQLKDLQLAIATQVRDVARQVQTNQKRVESARAARALAERRLDAEEKKFAAGIQTTFFVFQAQRDLAQARTNEVRAMADYNKSLVDFEAIQQTGLR